MDLSAAFSCLVLSFVSTTAAEESTSSPLCPANTKFYHTHELCYWDDTTIAFNSDAQNICQAGGGTLAFIPDQWAESFLADNLPISTYSITIFSIKEWWIGYKYFLGETTTLSGATPPYAPSLFSILSPYVVVRRTSPAGLEWSTAGLLDARKSLCSKFSDIPDLRDKEWVGVKGRLASSYVIKTLRTTSRIQCASICHLRNGCASFNFSKKRGVCELCRKFKAVGLTFDSSATDFQHFELKYRMN